MSSSDVSKTSTAPLQEREELPTETLKALHVPSSVPEQAPVLPDGPINRQLSQMLLRVDGGSAANPEGPALDAPAAQSPASASTAGTSGPAPGAPERGLGGSSQHSESCPVPAQTYVAAGKQLIERAWCHAGLTDDELAQLDPRSAKKIVANRQVRQLCADAEAARPGFGLHRPAACAAWWLPEVWA